MNKRSVQVLACWIMLIVVIPVVYLKFLETFVPHPGLRFISGWEDNTFQTSSPNPIWIDQNFTQGWTISWMFGQINISSGFRSEEGCGDLYALFSGFNYAHERGLSGIMIQKQIGGIDLSVYPNPYLVIRHKESSSDYPLMFSFGVTDDKGVWHDGGLYHVSSSWINLEFDLRSICSGTIRFISIRLTNDFDPNYVGGIQHAYIQLIAIYPERAHIWRLFSNRQINASISSENGVLKVYGSGDLSAGTIVTAQRFSDLSFDLNVYRYLKVSIMTSSVDVAARIVIWTDPSHLFVVLLKTFNDASWHTEIVDLSFFGITGIPYIVELSWMQISSSFNSSSTVWYSDLSFNLLKV